MTIYPDLHEDIATRGGFRYVGHLCRRAKIA